MIDVALRIVVVVLVMGAAIVLATYRSNSALRAVPRPPPLSGDDTERRV
jgi:hypothetical protein